MEAPDSVGLDFGELEEQGNRRVTVSDEIKSLQYTGIKPDSFTIDMERFSHLSHKDVIPNSRITLQRSLSRKGTQRGGGEKKTNDPPSADNEGKGGFVSASSPRAAVVGGTPEKLMLVSVGTSDQAMNPTHHQITIMTGQVGSATAASAAVGESRFNGKRFSFRRSPPPWTINPRSVLLFFATLSSMGTMLLIFFTLSMGKLGGDGNTMDQ